MDWRLATLFVAVFALLGIGVGSTHLTDRCNLRPIIAFESTQDPWQVESQTDTVVSDRASKLSCLVDKTVEDPVALFTAMLTLFTFLLFVATCGLWKMAVGQARDTKKSIEAAKRSAVASEIAVIHAQRAFIAVDTIELEPPPDLRVPGAFYNVRVIWKNSGTTPTRRGKNYSNWEALDAPAGSNYPFNDRGDEDPILFVIPPGASIPGKLLQVDVQWVNEAISGKRHLYLFGWCEYNDVFPETIRHRTEYCFKATVGRNISSSEATIYWALHDRYNATDGDCIKPIVT